MKRLFLLSVFVLICIGFTYAQDKNKEKIMKSISIPKHDNKSLDSISGLYNSQQVFSFNKRDSSVNIPNLYAQDRGVGAHNMPIKKLSGKNLAPMPGTENLDKLDKKFSIDSLGIYGKEKKE